MSTAVFGALEIKARNGLYVRQCENGGVEVGAETQVKDYTPPAATFALEEFFQAKRDDELGRWRWPVNPHLVVYPKPGDVVLVVDEVAGDYQVFSRAEVYAFEGLAYWRAARAYFEAHPERKLPTEAGVYVRKSVFDRDPGSARPIVLTGEGDWLTADNSHEQREVAEAWNAQDDLLRLTGASS